MNIERKIYYDPCNYSWGDIQINALKQIRNTISIEDIMVVVSGVEELCDEVRMHSTLELFIANHNPNNILTIENDSIQNRRNN
jgi:hypothetical protein